MGPRAARRALPGRGQLLEQPDVTGLEARNLVERRRAEAAPARRSDNPRVVDRIEHAPRAYLLSQEAADVARQAAFVEPVPSKGDASVAVLPVDPDPGGDATEADPRWRIEIAARDRAGLLATIAGVITDAGFDILDAAVATWGDGAALDTFLVQRTVSSPTDLGGLLAPDPVKLEAAIVAAFDDPLESLPNADADLRFDDHSSPWYTICEVRSPDRRGLLHSLTVGDRERGCQRALGTSRHHRRHRGRPLRAHRPQRGASSTTRRRLLCCGPCATG